jgi:hypothetical protein
MSATADHPGSSWTECAVVPAGVAPLGDPALGDPALADDLVAHLDAQLVSARRMAQIVLEQAAAIRRRAVRQVVVSAGELQVEMHRRELLERDRRALMERAARQLAARGPAARPRAIAPEVIGFSSVRELMDPETAQIATERTDELRDLLSHVSREHELNRALLAQELSFLDHLLGLAGGTGGYAARPVGRGPGGPGPGGEAPRIRRNVSVVRRRVFDLEA